MKHIIGTIPVSIRSFGWDNTLVRLGILLAVSIKVSIPCICLENTTCFFAFIVFKQSFGLKTIKTFEIYYEHFPSGSRISFITIKSTNHNKLFLWLLMPSFSNATFGHQFTDCWFFGDDSVSFVFGIIFRSEIFLSTKISMFVLFYLNSELRTVLHFQAPFLTFPFGQWHFESVGSQGLATHFPVACCTHDPVFISHLAIWPP